MNFLFQCLICPALLTALLTFPVVALAQDKSSPTISVEDGRIDVTLTAAPNRSGMNASVRILYQLRNGTETTDQAQRTFPLVAPAHRLLGGNQSQWCRVLVDGESVKFEMTQLVGGEPVEFKTAPHIEVFPSSNQPQREAWELRIEKWIQEDETLLDLVTEYRGLASVDKELNEVIRAFENRLKGHLLHEQDLQYAAVALAKGDPDFVYLVKLMPEIDPELRVDGPYARWKYASLLNDNDPEIYRPYEKEWREKAERWFAEKPDLAELLPKLRESWRSFRESQELLSGPILKHVHDVRGLSLPVALQFRSFLQSLGSSSEELPRTLFPDIRDELDAKAKATTQRLATRGFDQSIVSPFTGRLMPIGFKDLPDFSDLWRDSTVFEILERTPPKRLSNRNQRLMQSNLPALATFDAELEPGAVRKVAIEYEIPLGFMIHPWSSIHAGFPGTMTELACVFPLPRDIPVTVTVPANCHPVISPAPSVVTTLKNGERRFETRLTEKESTLHLVAVESDPSGGDYLGAYLGGFSASDVHAVKDLEFLIEKITNPTVRPLLMIALYNMLLTQRELYQAEQLALKTREEYPAFGDSFEAMRGRNPGAAAAVELFKWVEAKSTSPKLESDDDFKRFHGRHLNDLFVLNSATLTELARRVDRLDETQLDLQERMGRRFILCQAGVDVEQNLTELLKLAEANPGQILESLKLIQFLTIDKSAALPFVIQQIDLNAQPKLRAREITSSGPESLRRNAAYNALCSFQSPKAAPQIIQFIHTTDDALLIQGAMDALSHMTLPVQFEALVNIADRVAGASEGTFLQYIQLLVRSDRQKGIAVLEGLRDRYPKLASHILRELGQAGHPLELPNAISIYQTSTDTVGSLSAAVSVLKNLAEPTDIATLTYRKGLPPWMNESLVSVIRFKGGDKSVFPFVEAYYLEFVHGNKAHNHLTCVGAFEQIRDPRAVPYLKEIFQTTERKTDAAEAIGSILLNRQIKRNRNVANPIDEYLLTAIRADTSEELRVAAWDALLADPEASFRRIMKYGPVRSVMEDGQLDWSEEKRRRCEFISRFGDVAARHLLEASDGCSLERRYQIARLLELLLPTSTAVIQAAAEDESADTDRRHTAQLAFKLFKASP